MFGIESDYYTGYLEFPLNAVPNLTLMADAANTLYAQGLVAVYGRARRTRTTVRFPVSVAGFRGRRLGGYDSAVDALKTMFGESTVHLRRLNPDISNPQDLEIFKQLVTTDPEKMHLTSADFRPLQSLSSAGSDPFAGLVGLETQRRLVSEVANAAAVHGRGALESLHMVFVGPPGVGKTEVAQRLLALYDRSGVTSGKGRFVTADACDLIGEHVGETPRMVRDTVDHAMGGMLFIDEAYRLFDIDGKGFGHEAVDELVDKLESHRQDLVCIMAGYPDKMEQLFSMNAGLRDRFGYTVVFDEYTDAELVEIYRSMAEKRGFTCTSDMIDELFAWVGTYKQTRDFAYARTMRRLLDRTIVKQALRTKSKILNSSDLQAAGCEMFEQAKRKRSPIGFTM